MREAMKRMQLNLKQSHEEELAELVAENEHLHVQLADAQKYMKVLSPQLIVAPLISAY